MTGNAALHYADQRFKIRLSYIHHRSYPQKYGIHMSGMAIGVLENSD